MKFMYDRVSRKSGEIEFQDRWVVAKAISTEKLRNNITKLKKYGPLIVAKK